MSTPLDNQDVGNWSCMLPALLVEISLLAASGYTLTTKRIHEGAPVHASVGVEATGRRDARAVVRGVA